MGKIPWNTGKPINNVILIFNKKVYFVELKELCRILSAELFCPIGLSIVRKGDKSIRLGDKKSLLGWKEGGEFCIL